MHHGGGTDGTGGAQRVAQRNGTAHGVDLGGIQAQRVDHGQRLGGKCLVQLEPVDVVLLQAGIAQRGRNRLDRADTHDGRRHALACEADEARQRLQVVLLHRGFAGQDQRTGAVRGLRAVAGGDGATRRKHGAQLGQAFHGGVRPGAFVQIDDARADVDLAAGQVQAALLDLDRRDLVLELAGLHGGDGAAVRFDGKGVLRLAAHLPLLRHLFGGQAHAVGNAHVIALEDVGVQRGRVAHHGHHAHAFHTGSDHDVGFAHTDAVGRHGHGAQAGSAEAVHGDAAHAGGQAGQHGADARHVQALLRLGNGTAADHVLDAVWIQPRRLRHGRLDGLDQQGFGTGVAEKALVRTADGGTGGRNDVSVLHLLAHGDSLSSLSCAAACWCSSCT